MCAQLLFTTQTNDYSLILATDPSACKSYAIFQYGVMQWSSATSTNNPPTIGYGNGQCQGFQLTYPSGQDPASYAQQCQQLVYRVDGSFGQEVMTVQINKGNMISKAQQDKGGSNVIVQEFHDKTASMQDKLSLALQEQAREKNQVVLQHFESKD